MRNGLLKGLLLIATAASALFFARGLPIRKESALPPPSLAQGGKTQSGNANTEKPVPSDAHDAKVLALALEKNPGHTPVLFKLAKIESDEGHYQDAARHLRQILRKEPGNPEARLELGKVLFQLGDVQGAIDQTEEILKTHPTYEDALYNMGAIYGNLGNREKALQYWKRLAALNPGSESGQKAQHMMSKLQTNIP